MKKKVLITGGLGNLGSWITSHFCSQNYEVWVLSKNKRNLTEALPFSIIYADIADFQNLNDSLANHDFEYIIHTASVNDGFVENYAELSLKVNALGTRNLLECIKNKNVKHFIYFSTFQVYGVYEGLINEETPTLP